MTDLVDRFLTQDETRLTLQQLEQESQAFLLALQECSATLQVSRIPHDCMQPASQQDRSQAVSRTCTQPEHCISHLMSLMQPCMIYWDVVPPGRCVSEVAAACCF